MPSSDTSAATAATTADATAATGDTPHTQGGDDASEDARPALLAFLGLIDADIRAHPDHLAPRDYALLHRAAVLTKGVAVDHDFVFPDDFTPP